MPTLRTLFRDVKRTKLDIFLADKIASATITTETTIAVIKEEMLSVTELYIPTSYHLATNNEADTCMFLHAKHAVLGGINSINIVSSNTGVVTGLFDCLFVWFWLFFFF